MGDYHHTNVHPSLRSFLQGWLETHVTVLNCTPTIIGRYSTWGVRGTVVFADCRGGWGEPNEAPSLAGVGVEPDRPPPARPKRVKSRTFRLARCPKEHRFPAPPSRRQIPCGSCPGQDLRGVDRGRLGKGKGHQRIHKPNRPHVTRTKSHSQSCWSSLCLKPHSPSRG